MKLDDWYRARKADPEAMTAQEQALFDWLLEAELRGRIPRTTKPQLRGLEGMLDIQPLEGYA